MQCFHRTYAVEMQQNCVSLFFSTHIIVSLFYCLHCFSPRRISYSKWIHISGVSAASVAAPALLLFAPCAGYVTYREPIFFHVATNDEKGRGVERRRKSRINGYGRTENERGEVPSPSRGNASASDIPSGDIHALSHRRPTLK